MTPLTRKENYLNEIVGWGNTAPEKPTTPEEFFFAAILGEAVQVPDLSNASRYELFLAKIAGYNVNVSPPTYTSPRLEFFLAKAAGMDVVTPVPLTKEEIFWANYKGREQIIEGVPPLTFKSNGANLSNYRIYGNTVNGESVGDRTGNFYSCSDAENTDINGAVWSCKNQIITVNGTVATSSSTFGHKNLAGLSGDFILCGRLISGTGEVLVVCSIKDTSSSGRIYKYDSLNENIFFTLSGSEYEAIIYAQIRRDGTADNQKFFISLTEGSAPPASYEPYGYRVSATINSNTTNIYLPEQLAKTNDSTDYIDYQEQKQYFADGTSKSVELPALQTVEGTNTLSVETTVQPSKVMIKTGKFGTHKVRYYDSDGTFLSAEDVKDGTNAQGFTPTKASTAQYNYTFMGWSTTKGSTTAETGVLNDITADKSLYAVFSQSLKTFTVYFYNDSTLLQTAENVQYGGTATYTGETPTKDGFAFTGWLPSNVNITADTSCYAQFVEG